MFKHFHRQQVCVVQLNGFCDVLSGDIGGFYGVCSTGKHCDHIIPFIRLLTYLLTYLLTSCMGQSPALEFHRFSASQRIPCILWNPKFLYRIHLCSPPVSALSHVEPFYAITSQFLKINSNIIIPFTPGSS
jgi:hypothetical protein